MVIGDKTITVYNDNSWEHAARTEWQRSVILSWIVRLFDSFFFFRISMANKVFQNPPINHHFPEYQKA